MQRYIISTDHWCEGCPIFFYAGNEGDIFMFANNTGFMWENAASFKAMNVFVEHRYYGNIILIINSLLFGYFIKSYQLIFQNAGESMPYGNKSFKV